MPRAARQCPTQGCDNLIRGAQRHCPDHTVAWSGPRTNSSTITAGAAWRQLRTQVLDRDGHRCQIRYPNICTGRATTVDKIIPAARRPDLALDPTNARAACQPCNEHKARTEDRAPARRRR